MSPRRTPALGKPKRCWAMSRARRSRRALRASWAPSARPTAWPSTPAKSLRGSRHCIWEMDVYPDVAVALGVLAKGSLLDRAIGGLSDFSRRRSDRVIALGPCMRDLLVGRGIPKEKIAIAENWVDG